MKMVNIRSNELKMFIQKTKCNIKALYIRTFRKDQDYLDSDRWERLTYEYFINLEDYEPIDIFNPLFSIEK